MPPKPTLMQQFDVHADVTMQHLRYTVGENTGVNLLKKN